MFRPYRKRLHLMILLALTLACTGSAQTTISDSFLHGGIQRTYRLYIPAVYDAATPVPLVFNLHGYGSDNFQQEFYGDFRSIADTANFILVHPNGTLDQTGSRYWNTFNISQVDDLAFLMALLDTISAMYSIDPERVYSTGMSNGGFMSLDLACFRSERITAVASVTGTMASLRLNSCSAQHPTPVLLIHGTADPTVPYNGGTGLVSVPALLQYWAAYNGCANDPVITPVPDNVTTDLSTAEHQVYPSCDNDASVEHFKVIDGGHTWPGSPFQIGVTNQDFNASIEIWKFFNRYRLSELGTQIHEHEGTAISISPNPGHGEFMVRSPRTILELKVHDAAGRLVRHLTPHANEVPITFPGEGLHFVTISTTTGRSVHKVIGH